MTQNTAFDWRRFLLRWSGEWADSPHGETGEAGETDEESAARRARWLGFPAASEERIAAMERRLGRRMPPSYREFLAVSDGWRHAGGFVSLLAGTEQACWHDNDSGLAEDFEEYLPEDATPEERREAEIWRSGLQLDVESDALYVLMDPEDVDEDGEWAVYTWAGWHAAPPTRHANFREFMREMHREFHRLRVPTTDEGQPEFVNDTTRETDALVEEARLDALRGDWEKAVRALDEAKAYGRPRAEGLGDQIRRLLGRTHMVYFRGLATDPRYAPELLPPLVGELAAQSYRDDSTLEYDLRGGDEELLSRAYATLEQVRNGTYRYAPDGPFGEAVERARESARWGDTDEAWRTLIGALPLWEPLGPDHLAPLAWVADPLLGPLLTPERGRELLSTPRGGQRGAVPSPVDGTDPDGLAWLAEPDPGNQRTSYRFVLVEGVRPEDLPGRLGEEGAALKEPMTLWDAYRARDDKGEFSSYEDKAVMAVGRAGPGWSFAFDGEPAPFPGQRLVSPAGAASGGTRAVVVWGGLRTWRGKPFFHLSVAQDGIEDYTFTYEEGEIRASGAIPESLRPGRFFGDPEKDPGTERALLEAVGAEFGVRLPRHALTHGRMHTFTTRSWTRPPGDGEMYSVVTLNWGSAFVADGSTVAGSAGPEDARPVGG
ncbi:SMI1/KNR4 family protein [Streptomyces jietaisiensis]|uniref:SMI1/KNR4 family protein n=1 Tax=Streptomyces griseoaurantiacus TaxID=68213 RepID=UPI002E2C67D2|nr:SMI1/KNR4 family protein [Streptomyces jietaisiensis]